jgi:hypothetical protein
MKTIKLSEVENLIKEYSNQKSFSKPLMLWFASNRTLDCVKADLTRDVSRTISIMGHPFAGKKLAVLGDEVVKISDHPELLSLDELPEDYTKNTERIVYHTIFKQLKRDKLDYCCHQVKKLQVPFICLINDYEAAGEETYDKGYLAEHFEQFFVLNRTVNEWIEWACQTKVTKNQQGEEFNVPKIVPELVEYVRTHKDLFIESPALDGMPQEAVHTREARLNDISCAMRHAAWKPDFHHFFTKIEMEDSSQNFPFSKEYFYFTKREDFRQMLENYFNKGKE